MIRAMLLAIDVGNSNVTLGLFRAGALLGTRRARTDPRATADQIEHLLGGLLALDGLSLADIDAYSVASVVPSLTAGIEAVVQRRGGRPLIASNGSIPMAVRVDRPDEVGADRLVNVLAASRLYGMPAVVMDLGTATTLECAAADGAYVGGAIAPGLELGMEALAAHTAKLPRIELRAPDRAIGRNTVQAMQAGTILGYQALATGLLERVRTELAEANGVLIPEVHTILTGGLSSAQWARGIRGVDVIDPELTLKGLAILHAEVGGGEALELGLTGPHRTATAAAGVSRVV
jgi:type III pantothenate kinase